MPALLLTLLVAVGVLILWAHRFTSPGVPGPAPAPGSRPLPAMAYRAAPLLVDERERTAWRLLRDLAGALTVCPKVRLEDIAGAFGPDRFRLRGFVKSRHVDFLLVDEDWRPVLVVEVDGGSHGRADRQRRDRIVDGVLAAAGIPVLRLLAGADWRGQLEDWWASRRAAPERRSVATQVRRSTS